MTAWDVAAAVPDPELPMVTIGDLGILRDVEVSADGVVATITPTYSGCPALREIAGDVERRLRSTGHAARVRITLTPPWSTDMITADGRRKLAAAGIAPPTARPAGPVPVLLALPPAVPCPRCGSPDTRRRSAFGSTACKALYSCDACGEPFEHLKAI